MPEKSFWLNHLPWSVTLMVAEVLPMASCIFPVCVPAHTEPAACAAECLCCAVPVLLTAGALLVGWAAPGMRD